MEKFNPKVGINRLGQIIYPVLFKMLCLVLVQITTASYCLGPGKLPWQVQSTLEK